MKISKNTIIAIVVIIIVIVGIIIFGVLINKKEIKGYLKHSNDQYEIQYPEKWTTADGLFMSDDSISTLQIEIKDIEENLVEYKESRINAIKNDFEINDYKEKDIVVNGIKGIKMEYSMNIEQMDMKVYVAETVLEKEGKGYVLLYSSQNEINNKIQKNMINSFIIH